MIGFTFFSLVLLLACDESVETIELQPHSLLSMQRGVGWPQELHVVEGHEALLRVDGALDNLQSCIVTTSAGIQFDVHSPPEARYEAWSDSCGLRVRSVVKADEGRWRLTATGGGKTIDGWSAVIVTNDTSSYSGPEIDLLDGATHTEVELTTLDNSYCLVAQPFSESSLVPGHCRVTLDSATRAVQGNWNVLLGLPGRLKEIKFQRKVAVKAESLDTGYIRDTTANKLNLYCNILNTHKNITFCRFQKISHSAADNPIGYNVMDGLSDGTHSYYGEGFLHRHCGMTIEKPSSQDFGTWRCSVGVQQWVGNTVEQQTPLQALISIGPDNSNNDEVQTVLVQQQQSFTVSCRAAESLAYCWFRHPNGSSFTPMPLVHEEQPYWYTGENLQVGDCGITFKHATETEAGLWTCHMGPRNKLGMEMTNKVEVRVAGPLAANKRNVSASIGDTVHLYCHTSNGNKPLDYCRFLTPTALGFRIDSTVTEESAILGRYFFMPGKNLDHGDCALTIKGVKDEDFGEWTCAALINRESTEASDIMEVSIGASRAALSQAGIAGMVIGCVVLIVALVGMGLYKTGYLRRRPQRTEAVHYAVDTQSNDSRSSGASSEHNEDFNNSALTIRGMPNLGGNSLRDTP